MPMLFSTTINLFDRYLSLLNNFSSEGLILIGTLITLAGVRILIYANEESKKNNKK